VEKLVVAPIFFPHSADGNAAKIREPLHFRRGTRPVCSFRLNKKTFAALAKIFATEIAKKISFKKLSTKK
jgi:hypothetical protein